MADPLDYEFQRTDEPPVGEPPASPPSRPPAGPWIAFALLVVGAAAAAYILFSRPAPEPEPEPTVAETLPVVEQIEPLGGEAEPIVLPPLGEGDDFVRDLVRTLSSHPTVLAWLTTDGLIRHFTVVVAAVAEGRTPAAELRRLRPSSGFQIVERGDTQEIDPRSYDRYSGIAEAVASIDADGAARLYSTLKPRIEEAHAELGTPGTPFDRTLERAIVQLLGAPIPEEPVLVVPRGIGYGFIDPQLEELPAAQKQLLRFGPRNARIIQNKLREIALALGIPASRLP